MVHLDEYYMDSDYAEAELSLLKASTYSAYAQLGASIVYDSVDDWLSNEQDDAPKPFMQYCPIHYRASSSIKALIDMFRCHLILMSLRPCTKVPNSRFR